jgi:hypothetical protein
MLEDNVAEQSAEDADPGSFSALVRGAGASEDACAALIDVALSEALEMGRDRLALLQWLKEERDVGALGERQLIANCVGRERRLRGLDELDRLAAVGEQAGLVVGMRVSFGVRDEGLITSLEDDGRIGVTGFGQGRPVYLRRSDLKAVFG